MVKIMNYAKTIEIKGIKKTERDLKGDCIEYSSTINTIKETITKRLMEKAAKIRKRIVLMISQTCSGHVGGCFSSTDLLTSLYFYKMRIDPKNPQWEDRDRFILSKGHAAPLLYSILIECGFLSEEEQCTLRKINTRLQGHPTMRTTPGVDMTTGSLGMGLSAGCGMAIASKLENRSNKIYVLLGDGELQEGQVWEAVMTASHFHLNNVIAIVDKNNLQSDSPVKSVSNTGDLGAQFKSFNWNVLEINGHNFMEIIDALDTASNSILRPTVIIANTRKGKGVSFMEDNPMFHAITPSTEQIGYALSEIKSNNKSEN